MGARCGLFSGMNQTWTSPIGRVGRYTTDTAAAFGRFGAFASSIGRGTRDVGTWGRLVVFHMARLGVESLPIALFIAGFTGIVLALQASYTFTGAIPLYFVGVLVGKTMILELGPVLTGLALAGRVGANIAAEIGTMRVTEQIDALETLGYDPFAYLVVPRVIAGVLMFPVVVAFADAIGVLGGWITAINLLDMSTPQFLRGLRLFFQPFDIQFSLIKAASFGLSVTSIGAFYGYNTMGGAAAVGRSTTQAVVVSSMLILVLDAFWAVVLL
jgi:phospholipid/cholesterol/gamma-HCH transport system permease protein